jgi:kynurenine 3-monooxygenase
MKKSISIAGAGLVGSLCALYMCKRGYKTTIFERRNDLRSEIITAGKSINLALSTRGWTALKKVGADIEVEKIAIPMYKRVMHDTEGNLVDQAYGNPGQAIYSVARAELNVMLMQLAEKNGTSIECNEKCVDIDFKTGTTTFENTFTKKIKKVTSDLVVGADGAFSNVRSQMIKRRRQQYSQHYIDHAYKELLIPANQDGTHKIEKNALHIWPRGNFMLIALPNMDGSYTCTLFAPYEGKYSFEELNSKENILAYFNKIFPDFAELVPDLYDQFISNPTSPMAIMRTDPWHVFDKAVLVGDSAHATVPFYGQGMNSGFEDCRVLDELLDKHEDNLGECLEEYSRVRKPNGDGVQDLSMHNFIVMRDKTADPSFLLQKKIEQKFAQRYPEKWTPLYSMVSFSNISYAEAWKIGQHQEKLMETIMKIPKIETLWDEEEIMEKISELI